MNSHQQKLCSDSNHPLGEPTAATRVQHCQPSGWQPCLCSPLLPQQHSQQNGTKWTMTVLSQCTAWIISTSHLLWQFSLNSIRWDADIFPPLCFATVPVTATEPGTEKFHLRRKVTLSATTAMCPWTHLAELILQRALPYYAFLWDKVTEETKKRMKMLVEKMIQDWQV